jgi:CRISPR-associated protein Cas2
MFLVIAYDVRDDARRLRLANVLEDWGQRTQWSVFECDVTEPQAEDLIKKLRELCAAEDALRIYRLCAACLDRVEVVGGKELAVDKDFYQV